MSKPSIQKHKPKMLTKRAKLSKARLTIGLVLDDSLDPPDGVQQYVLGLGQWLTAQGHTVHYLTGQTKRQDIAHLHSLTHNMAVRFNRNRMSIPLPISRRAARTFLQKYKFDVLHVQTPYSPWLAGKLIAASSSETVVIGTFHIAPYSRKVVIANKLLRLWLRPTLKRFDAMVSVSSVAHDFALQTFGIESVVIPNMVDVQQFMAAHKRRSGTARMTIVFLGRFVERKGCADLLKAIHLLQKQKHDLPSYRVLIGGTGPLESKLKAYVQTKKLESHVRFVGFIPESEKADFLANAALAVFPSHSGESFGIVLLEAMASGAVTLAAANPGYRAVLADNSQVLFQPHDVHGLANLLEGFLQDAHLRKAVRAWQQTHVQKYSQATVGTEILSVYQQALRNRRHIPNE